MVRRRDERKRQAERVKVEDVIGVGFEAGKTMVEVRDAGA